MHESGCIHRNTIGKFLNAGKFIEKQYLVETLFPAHAGMNRFSTVSILGEQAVPRTRGDEPRPRKRRRPNLTCSPHTRG